MVHGKAGDSLQPLTVRMADSICQELIKQQGNKPQAPKPSLEGRLATAQVAEPLKVQDRPANGLPRLSVDLTDTQAADPVRNLNITLD